jgi:hypothetical protein
MSWIVFFFLVPKQANDSQLAANAEKSEDLKEQI